ncbi:hypothetical protein ACSBR2_020432 [Camellia fascicularis]
MTRALLCSNLSNSFPLIPLLAIALVILLHSLIIGKRVQIVVHGMRSHVITPLLMSLASIVTAYMVPSIQTAASSILFTFKHLNLSRNNFNHSQILPSFGRFTNLTHLDLRYSHLSGPIQSSEEEVWQGNNHLNEELNPLCNLYSLLYLHLSNNQFGGLILTCLGNFSGYLMVLNLQSNNFSGTIPQTFEYASLLLELDISNNGLQGVLPTSLANCTNLEILNVGHNFIEDAFPFWLENLPQLKIIVLRDNKFHGPIQQLRKRLAFTNLHIIDMSHNEFTAK